MGTRCSDATSEAVRIFRLTGNARYVPAIVRGILEQQVPAELLPKLYSGDSSLRLAEDLGVDSLALMEIALRAEDAAGFPFETAELARVATVGDFERALQAKWSLRT
jgi:acyl carrier protein